MVLDQYTQNIIIKNSKELVKNAQINSKNGYIESISSLSPINTSDNLGKKQIISAGFINLHAHLAYTNLNLNSKKLFSWLKDLVKEINDDNFEAESASISGAKMALASGTTFLIDNTSHFNASLKAFSNTKLRGIIALELFGSDGTQAKNILDNALEIIEANKLLFTQNFKVALAPHSLYSVSPELLIEITKYLQDLESSPFKDILEAMIFMHFAEDELEEKYFKQSNLTETNLELDLMLNFWQSLGLLDLKKKHFKSALSSWDYLKRYYIESLEVPSRMLLTHVINLSESEIQELSTFKNFALVSCPRSNEFLLHNKAAVDLWEAYALDYALGTDSKASNFDLDLRLELKALLKRLNNTGALDPSRQFELLTSSAAKAIGKEHEIGSLEPNKYADYVIFELLDDSLDLDSINPYLAVLDPELTRVSEVYVGGDLVYKDLVAN